jgi:lipoprotein-anchoring transpeptidase ErfK/SrfK
MVLLPYNPGTKDSRVAADTNSRAPLVTSAPPGFSSPTNYPRSVQNVFELQVVLAGQGISCGSLDGVFGPQTRSALRSFQQKEHLAITGELDSTTREALLLTKPATASYVVTSNDLARLQPLSSTWLGKSQQSALEYESILELVSERAQSSPALVRRLNPGFDWTNVVAGTSIELPDVSYPQPTARAASIVIKLGDKILEAWDENTNLLVHFPCSIARQVEKRPVGELHVAVLAPHPNYTFDPDIFPESTEARELKTKLVLPPGPNNPVGVAWIGLDKPGYGIHGTPSPEQVGRTESHGCFRLANWNAEYLLRLVVIGTPVFVQP